jgi:PIN domain nuclease of toxin-antitoxin system
MKIILDTHILLWFLNEDKNLSPEMKGVIENLENEITVSIASLWEIAIKMSLSKLTLDIPYKNLLLP